MKWVTRERPKVDRVACPWLISRFVDPAAEFLYVPADQVMAVAEREGATPFDVPNVELGHHGANCSFDAILHRYNLSDPALHKLALIVGCDRNPSRSAFDRLRANGTPVRPFVVSLSNHGCRDRSRLHPLSSGGPTPGLGS